MPKLKIEAKKVLDDIRAGLDDAALMEKYNLSIKGLHSVLEKLVALKALNESYIWTGRPPRESGPGTPNRELSAKEVTRDIKSGMADGELMRKYKLSAKGLQNLLEQLMEAGVIKESDLEFGKPLMESTVELTSDMLPPFGDSVVEAKNPTEPLSTEIEGSHAEVAPTPEKPQEVQVMASSDPAFPSTVPITAVTEQEREETAGPAGVPPEEPHEPASREPQEPPKEPPREQPVRDLWASTAPVSAAADEKPRETPPEVESLPAPTVPVQEKSPSGDYEQTIELVWKCPACGKPQTEAYDECPICGIVVSKFIDHQKKATEAILGSEEKKPEPKAGTLPPPAPEPRARDPHIPEHPAPEPRIAEPSAPEHTTPGPLVPEPPAPEAQPPETLVPETRVSTTAKPRPVPAAPRPEPAIKPRRSSARPSIIPEEIDEPELPASGLLSGAVTFMAIAQLVGVLVYVGIELCLARHQLFSLKVLAWSFAVPILISGLVAALLHSVAVLITLGRETLSATVEGNRLLRELLRKLDKHTT